MIKINPKKIVKFFDKDNGEHGSHVSSFNGLCGEDLVAGLFKHYLEHGKSGHSRASVEILPQRLYPTTGRSKGRKEWWLDRWIVVTYPTGKRTLFQAEIKNWTAQGLPSDASPEMLKNISKRHFDAQWRGIDRKETNVTNKVLERMSKEKLVRDGLPPEIIKKEPEPLLIYWLPISYDGKLQNPLFSRPLKHNTKNFRRVWIFSASLYLRTIMKSHPVIGLEMPDAEARLQLLKGLFKLKIRTTERSKK